MREGAAIEVALSVLAIIAWAGVMVRFWPDLMQNQREKAYSALVVCLVVWSTLAAFLVRALADVGVVRQELTLVSGGMVRGVFLIAGIVLILIGPVTRRKQ